jgi:adenylate kinase
MLRIVLLGAPGSGKGTQAARLAAETGARHISTGELLRAEVAAGTELGHRVAGYLAGGELVPDGLLLGLALPLVVSAGRDGGYILDGFPRSVGQARELDERLDPAVALTQVLFLQVPRPELVARLLRRASEQGRPDDTAAVIQRRLRVFDSETRTLISYYRAAGLLREVPAAGPPEAVFALLSAAIES